MTERDPTVEEIPRPVEVEQNLQREPNITEGYTVSISPVKFVRYQPKGQKQMKLLGRWKTANEYGGWDNCETPKEIWPEFPTLARMALRAAEAEARAERAEKLIRQCVQGDYHRPVGKPFRDDGLPSKHDKCIHDAWMYEDCGSCIDLHFAALDTPRPASPSPATVEAMAGALDDAAFELSRLDAEHGESPRAFIRKKAEAALAAYRKEMGE